MPWPMPRNKLKRSVRATSNVRYTQMLHGAGIFTYIYPKNGPNVGKYSIYIEHLGYGMYRDHSDTWIHGSTRIGAGMDYGWTLLPEYILGRRVAEKPHDS